MRRTPLTTTPRRQPVKCHIPIRRRLIYDLVIFALINRLAKEMSKAIGRVRQLLRTDAEKHSFSDG